MGYDGYRVVAAANRAQALELLRLHEPAVVTLDLGLPPDPDGTTEGFATLTDIIALKPDTKVIVASGTARGQVHSKRSLWVPTISTRNRSILTHSG